MDKRDTQFGFIVDDIQYGFVVELRNKQKFLAGKAENCTPILVNPLTQEWCYLSAYDNDLKHNKYEMRDIVRVWGLVKGTSNYWAALLPYVEDRELLWEREKDVSIFERLETAFHDLGNVLDVMGKDEEWW